MRRLDNLNNHFVEILHSELKWDRELIEKKVKLMLSRIDNQVIYDLAKKWDSLQQKLVTCEILVGRYNLNLLYVICEKLNGKYIETIKTDFDTLTRNIKFGEKFNM
jgi:hypothetical protein